jgi:hypothetical protein
MTTSMHRMQISLPRSQAEFLARRARRERVSMAEVVRRLVQREADAAPAPGAVDSLWTIAGIGEDPGTLHGGIAVSERPDLYLADLAAPCEEGAPRVKPRRKRSRR